MAVDYSSDLHELARLVATPHGTDEVLERALAALATVVPYDLAAVFRLHGSEARIVAAAGALADPIVRGHQLDLAEYPTIRRALETRRPVPLADHHHASREGDPYDGVLDLPHGHSCMVVPLFAGDRSLGLITLDRSVCVPYPPQIVELAGVYGQLISLALLFADQAALLDRYRHQLKDQNRLLAQEVGDFDAVRKLEAARSDAMRDLVRMARQVAASDLPVLIQGETGTGKEVLAQALHAWSPRVDGPFIKLNCSAIPENLVESELFGHKRGAFSGANQDRRGRFLTANGGTLLLDEIGDMPLAAQSKLLRVLQEGTFEPVGSDRTVKVDVRVLAASNIDLEEAVALGRFREDLYYRLAVFPLTLPPLRERRMDIPGLAISMLDAEHRRGRGPWSLQDASLAALANGPWPGNVRQLKNTLERATILCPRGPISPLDLGLWPTPNRAPKPQPSTPTWEQNERAYFRALLESTDNKIYGDGGAAALAGLKPTTLRSKLVKLGLR